MTRGILGRYELTGPCSNCPFRSDRPFYLDEHRVDELADALLAGDSFTCHKTVDYTDEGAVVNERGRECGGAMATLEREGRPNQGMRIAGRLGFYDPDRIRADAPVYDSIDEWREAMK